jgi:Arylsulfotransferase (ASST)
LHLDESGTLIVSFQSASLFPYGVGIAKFSWSGNLIWKKANFSHHWFSVAPDGRIYTPTHVLQNGPLPIGNTSFTIDCGTRPIYGEEILVLNQYGETVEEISLMNVLVQSGFSGLIAETEGRERCDPSHLNYVEYVSAEAADKVAGLEQGDLIISVKHLNLIAVLESKSRRIKWSVIGKTIMQHTPRFFDNMGGSKDTGGSRVVRLNYGSDKVKTLYPAASADHDTNFWTRDGGHLDPHPDGTRALVSLRTQGRVLEIDLQEGRVLWELVNSHDLGSYAGRLGADEGEIVRLSATGAYYVDQPAPLGD